MIKRRPEDKFSTPKILHGGAHVPVWMWPTALVVILVWTWLVFDYGRQRAGFDAGESANVQEQLRAQITELEKERDELRKEAAKSERTAGIERDSVVAVQGNITELQKEKAELQKRVDFLESLVSDRDPHFKFVDFTLKQRKGDNNYRYSFSVSKMSKGNSMVRGSVSVNIHGQEEGKDKTLSLADITEEKQKKHKLGFRHFQNIEGNMTLPEGFVPKSFEIKVIPTVKNFKATTKSFDWDLS